MTLLPEKFDRQTWFPAVFLTAIPALVSLFAGIYILKIRPEDIGTAMVVAGIVGLGLAYALSIRGGDPLFSITMGCILLTMLVGLLTLTYKMPWFLTHVWVVVNIALAVLAVRIILEAVMPRAEQLAS